MEKVNLIIKHFRMLGGLSYYSKKSDGNINLIEKHIGGALNPLLKEVWQKFEGMMFNKTVVIENINIPMADDGVINFNGFLPLSEETIDLIDANYDLFMHKFIPFAEALPGDFYSIDRDNGGIYYISHDFNPIIEQSAYFIFNDINTFFMSLKVKEECNEPTPQLVKFRLDPSLLKKK